jgi:aerobic C4-dicarboxylate transport protein
MKFLRILYVQVIIGIVLGILAGFIIHDLPADQKAGWVKTAKLVSDTFINMIRMMIVPIIFFTIILGIVGAGNMKKVGRVGGKAIIYFELVTTIALIIGLLVANFIQPGHNIDPKHVPPADISKYTSGAANWDWGKFISDIVPENIIAAFAKGDIIQILFFGILFAFGLRALGKPGEALINTFENINKVLFNVLKIIIQVSPVGAFGGMAYTVGTFGFGSLTALGALMLTFYITSLLFIFVVLNTIARFYGFSLWRLLGYIKAEILIVFGASSSEAVLPNLMQKMAAAGCDRSVVGLVIPTGYSFNLDGKTIYLSMAVLFISQAFNIPLSIGQQLTIIGILMLTSKGAAAVTGGGFIVLSSTLAAMKILPVEGLAMLIGIDRFMSEARAITNMIGNTVATVVIAKSEKAVNMDIYRSVVEGKPTSTKLIEQLID